MTAQIRSKKTIVDVQEEQGSEMDSTLMFEVLSKKLDIMNFNQEKRHGKVLAKPEGLARERRS